MGLDVDDELAPRRARWVAAASSIVGLRRSENVPPVPGTEPLDRVTIGCVSGGPLVPGLVGGDGRDVGPDVELAASSLLHAASAVNVAAIPQLDRRNARRDIPNRRALVSATASVRRIASATRSERCNGGTRRSTTGGTQRQAGLAAVDGSWRRS